MSIKIEPRTLPGFMELLPNEQILFNQMREKIQKKKKKFKKNRKKKLKNKIMKLLTLDTIKAMRHGGAK